MAQTSRSRRAQRRISTGICLEADLFIALARQFENTDAASDAPLDGFPADQRRSRAQGCGACEQLELAFDAPETGALGAAQNPSQNADADADADAGAANPACRTPSGGPFAAGAAFAARSQSPQGPLPQQQTGALFESGAVHQGPHDRRRLLMAAELYSRGASYKTVAASLGVSVYTARDWMHRYRNGTFEGLLNERSLRGRHFDQSVKARVLSLRYERGLSYNAIVRETGLSRATIRRWLAAKNAPGAREPNAEGLFCGLESVEAAPDKESGRGETRVLRKP